MFAVKTDGGTKITLFEQNGLSNFISDESKRDSFCRAILNKLADFNFEQNFQREI